MKQKIALGTVQLGLPYGANNKTGKPDKQEAFKILDKALENGITLLDSAEAYGDSLLVIGSFLKERGERSFEIISKFIGDNVSLSDKVSDSLNKLSCRHLYAYMYHRFSDYKSKKYSDELRRLKNEGKIQRIGVSLYGLPELEMALSDPEIDLIQIPLNPFDCSAEKKALLANAKSLGKEIHVRSVFLQGVFFKQPNELPASLQELSDSLDQFHQVLKKHNLEVREACLNYALHQPYVDHVLVGVETQKQLIENIDAVMENFPAEVTAALESISVSNASLLDPSNWKA